MTLYKPATGETGADTSGIVTAADAAELKAKGHTYLIRSLACPDSALRLAPPTLQEVADIRGAGLALGFYQTFQTAPATAAQGTKDGGSAVMQADALGAPKGMTLWCDMEGAYHNTTAAGLVAYLNAWAKAVVSNGYIAGLYNGPQPLLSGGAIGSLPDFHAYWQAGAIVPTPVPRGECMIQLNPPNIRIGGMVYDLGVCQEDFKGGAPVFWGPS